MRAASCTGAALPGYVSVDDPVVQRVLPADALPKARAALKARR
jgi:hypothetical protein